MNEKVSKMENIAIIETPYNLDDKNLVCYPNLIIYFKINIFRLFMKPRVVYSVITVDLVKGDAARANMYPEYRTIEINNTALITKFTTNEIAIENAKKLLIKWVRHKFKVYKIPDIEIIKQQEVYKAFFQAKINNKTVLVDSVKGIEME